MIKKQFKSLINNIVNTSRDYNITELLNYSHIKGYFIISKTNNATLTIKVNGFDYNGLPSSELERIYNYRNKAFKNKFQGISLKVVSKRYQVKKKKISKFSNSDSAPVIEQVLTKWNKQFDLDYILEHFIVLEHNENKLKLVEQQENLLDVYHQLRIDLAIFGLTIISGSELINFYSNLINLDFKDYSNFDDIVLNQDYEFSKDHIYLTNTQKYVGILNCNHLNASIEENCLLPIFTSNLDVFIFSSFVQYNGLELESFLRRKQNSINNNNLSQIELQEVIEQVERGELTLNKSQLFLFLIAETKESLDSDLELIQQEMAKEGISFYRDYNLIGCFFSAYQGFFKKNPRIEILSNENLASINTFANDYLGEDYNLWLNEPITKFKTAYNNTFNFNFHSVNSSNQNNLGHTLVVGGSGAGKSLLIMFLILNSLRIKNLKSVCFDSNNGLEIFTNVLRGDYIDIGINSNFNPLLSREVSDAIDFIVELLEIDADSELYEELKTNIEDLYKAPKNKRNFSSLLDNSGIEIKNKLTNWVFGGKANYFNGDSDFDLSNRLTTFNFNDETKDVEHIIANYLFRNLKRELNGDPKILFFDELFKFINKPSFKTKFIEAIREYRKKNVVVIGATQDIKDLDQANDLLSSFNTYIFFPDPSLKPDEAIYKDKFSLTDTEFETLISSDTPARSVLIKKKQEANSSLLNVDLSYIGDMIDIFLSKTEFLKKAKDRKPIFNEKITINGDEFTC